MFKFNSSTDFANPVGSLIKTATESSLPTPDWSKNIEICDMITRGKDCPEQAMKALLRRLKDHHENTIYLSLVVVETCMKNCGQNFAICIHQKIFLDEVIEIAKGTKGAKNSEQALNLIQQWGRMYERNQRDSFPLFFDTFLSLKSKGFLFPREDPLPPTSTSQELERRPFMRKSSTDIAPIISSPTQNNIKSNNTTTTSNQSSEQLEKDLNVVAERIQLCQETLLVSPGIDQDELLKELIGFLEACKDRMIELIEAGFQGLLSEELFALVLKINDDVIRTLDTEKNGASDKKVQSDSNLIDISTPVSSCKVSANPVDDLFTGLVAPVYMPPQSSTSEVDVGSSNNPFDDSEPPTSSTAIAIANNGLLPPQPPQAVVYTDDSFHTKQTLPQAPELDELDLMLANPFKSSNDFHVSTTNSTYPILQHQQPTVNTTSNDVDIDKFFESLNTSTT